MVHKQDRMFRSKDGNLFVYEGQPKCCPFCTLLFSKSRKGDRNEKEENSQNKNAKSVSRSFASHRKRVQRALQKKRRGQKQQESETRKNRLWSLKRV